MNVLVLMHFPIHMRVCVCVDVCVDLWVDFGCAPLGQEKLLLLGHEPLGIKRTQMFLVAGRRRTRTPFTRRRWAILVGHGLVCDDGARGTLLFRLAKPKEDRAQDEHHAGGDANDDRPGQAGRHRRGDGVVVRAGVCT